MGIQSQVKSPLQAVKDWAAENDKFTGLVITTRVEPRGKGGRRRRPVGRLYLAREGKVIKYKTDYKTWRQLPGWNRHSCGARQNGECECCHQFFADLDLMHVRVASVEQQRRSLISYGWICMSCRRQFQLPVSTPIKRFILKLPDL